MNSRHLSRSQPKLKLISLKNLRHIAEAIEINKADNLERAPKQLIRAYTQTLPVGRKVKF